MSDSCFYNVLLLIGSMLPKGNNIFSSFNDAKKTLCTLWMRYEKIHACPNNCLLYRGERDEDESTCRICNASAWKLNKKGEEEEEGNPAKVLWYFPLLPWLRNFFNTPQIAKDMTWHDTRRQKDGKLRHLADSDIWKDVDQKWPDFTSESRNIQLPLSANGFDPFCGNPYWSLKLANNLQPSAMALYEKKVYYALLVDIRTDRGLKWYRCVPSTTYRRFAGVVAR